MFKISIILIFSSTVLADAQFFIIPFMIYLGYLFMRTLVKFIMNVSTLYSVSNFPKTKYNCLLKTSNSLSLNSDNPSKDIL